MGPRTLWGQPPLGPWAPLATRPLAHIESIAMFERSAPCMATTSHRRRSSRRARTTHKLWKLSKQTRTPRTYFWYISGTTGLTFETDGLKNFLTKNEKIILIDKDQNKPEQNGYYLLLKYGQNSGQFLIPEDDFHLAFEIKTINDGWKTKHVDSLCKFKHSWKMYWIAKSFILPLHFVPPSNILYFFNNNSNETRRNWGTLAAPDFANSGKTYGFSI